MAEVMTGLKRTHYCGEPRLSDVEKKWWSAAGPSGSGIWDS